jgi:hypothetical protein
MTSLPLLFKVSSLPDLAAVVVGKISLGVGIKLLDNLNDEIQSREEAREGQHRMFQAMTTGQYRLLNGPLDGEPVNRATNSALEMGSWLYSIVAPTGSGPEKAFHAYLQDISRFFEGQLDSLGPPPVRPSNPFAYYFSSLAEKSIGALWFGIDLCLFERRFGYIDNLVAGSISTFRQAVDLLFKCLLIYDDVEDLAADLRNRSPNLAVMMGLQVSALKQNDLTQRPEIVLRKLAQTGILVDTILWGDQVFDRSIRCLKEASVFAPDLFDWKGLTLDFHYIRLFLLRKILQQWHLLGGPELLISPIMSLSRKVFPRRGTYDEQAFFDAKDALQWFLRADVRRELRFEYADEHAADREAPPPIYVEEPPRRAS